MGISVIVPVYNTEQYLDDCITSVIRQSVAFDKIILVNDGSTDSSLEICKRYAEKYPNIFIISQENQGQGAARNIGLRYVDSEYVMFLDSDDYIQSNAAEKIICHMSADKLDILYFDSYIKNELDIEITDNFYDRVHRVIEKVSTGREYFVDNYPKAYVVQPCMVAFRTEFLKRENITFPEHMIFEDAVFSFKAMISAERVKYISDKLYVRRYRPNSTMTKQMTYKDYRDIYNAHMMCWEHMLVVENTVDDQVLNSFRIYLIRSYWEMKRYLGKLTDITTDLYMDENNKLGQSFLSMWDRFIKQDQRYITLSLLSCVCRLIQGLDMEKDHCLYRYFCTGRNNLKKVYWDLYEERLVGVLNELPLKNTEAKVGIYGTGNHTKKLLNWFKYFTGDINCKLYFIDTYKKSFSAEYNGTPVINIKDAGRYVDTVILSSIAYEDEMYVTVRNMYEEKINVIRFYDKEKDDIFIDFKI